MGGGGVVSSSCCRHKKFVYKFSSMPGNESKSLDFGNFISSFGIFQAVRFGTSILQTSYFRQIVLSDSQSLRYRSEIFRDHFGRQ